jgi:hypothetical protein
MACDDIDTSTDGIKGDAEFDYFGDDTEIVRAKAP